jgi:thermitase
LLDKYNLNKIEREWLGDKVYLLKTNQTNEQLIIEIANQIYESGFVEYSHPDFIVFNWPESSPNDEYYGSQWNLTKISASNAWDISTGNSSIIIAILDYGILSNHPDLDGHLVTGYDVVDNDNTTSPLYDDLNHGTACAGIASAETNNGPGIAGVGYNCSIMPIQFTHSENWSNSTNFAAGINWAASHGAHIISISGSTNTADVVSDAIYSATSNGRNGKGCVIVKSAGNEGTTTGEITYPGKHPKVICVGATDQNDVKKDYSSYGPEL